ncbi:hypothetical protein [Actinotalea subterranea]|uniref:hypothetical protein n=1 Tax=Actinotalea subterranea TaxID=2607497 RepID=UPI0011EDE532|nr:hypothetical protein [Actinotalea subterranea]
MLLLRGSATRWINDEPMPGLVQIEITDADARVHRLVEKSAVVGANGVLHEGAEYPIDVEVACNPRHQAYRSGEARTVNVVDLSPWGVDDPDVLYPVERDQLSWDAPAVYSDLSICARQGVALVTFRRWREIVGLDCEELSTLEDHLWEFASVTPETFAAWYESHPLVRRGSDDPLPAEVESSAALHGLDQVELRQAVRALTVITYGGLFGRVESEWSLTGLQDLAAVTGARGVGLAPPDRFLGSLWVDGDWGHPSTELVGRWRAPGVVR